MEEVLISVIESRIKIAKVYAEACEGIGKLVLNLDVFEAKKTVENSVKIKELHLELLKELERVKKFT